MANRNYFFSSSNQDVLGGRRWATLAWCRSSHFLDEISEIASQIPKSDDNNSAVEIKGIEATHWEDVQYHCYVSGPGAKEIIRKGEKFMPPTPIPDDLIQNPEQVERNAERFDVLCQLTEEVVYPLVTAALAREFEETTTKGAEILSDEAKSALTMLGEEAILEGLDESVLSDFKESFRESLSRAVPEPDEQERRQHAREFSQMLMSAWLETLRSAQSQTPVLLLSDLLLPATPSSGIECFMERFARAKHELPQLLIDAIAWSAMTQDDTAEVLTTLREKLFSEPRLVDLPFDLAMIGAPRQPLLASTRSFFVQISPTPIPLPVAMEPGFAQLSPALSFAGELARRAAAYLSEPLAKTQYGSMAMEASTNLQTSRITTQVQQAINTD